MHAQTATRGGVVPLHKQCMTDSIAAYCRDEHQCARICICAISQPHMNVARQGLMQKVEVGDGFLALSFKLAPYGSLDGVGLELSAYANRRQRTWLASVAMKNRDIHDLLTPHRFEWAKYQESRWNVMRLDLRVVHSHLWMKLKTSR